MDDFTARPYFEDHEVISLSFVIYTMVITLVITLMVLCIDGYDADEMLIPPYCHRQEDNVQHHECIQEPSNLGNEHDASANNQPYHT